jgi:hypothetical protein
MVGVYTSPDSPEKVYQYYTTQPSIITTSHSAIGLGSHYVGRVKISSPVDSAVTTAPHESGSLIVMVITGGSGR